MSSGAQRLSGHVAYRRRRIKGRWRSFVVGGHHVADAVWISSWQRSGSTWLAEMLSTPKRTRLVYEPANLPDRCFDGAEAAVIAPPLISIPHTRSILRGIEGQVSHWWTDQFNESHFPQRVVAKDVRGLGLAGNIADELPETPIIILARNPVAVAKSVIRVGWFDPAVGAHDAFLAEVKRWCDYHERALRDERLQRALWVSYEDLVASPASELNRIKTYLLNFSKTWKEFNINAIDFTRRSATDFAEVTGESPSDEWLMDAAEIVSRSAFHACYTSSHPHPMTLSALVDSLRVQ